jgi:Cellobiose phosphorylase
MAHHQAMSLLALATVLLDGPMQKRFMKDPHFKASSLLLEERIPRLAPDYLQTLNPFTSQRAKAPALKTENRLRVFSSPDEQEPAVQLLSNSNYHVMVNSSGAGYSRYHKMAVTRWRQDPVADELGLFCYLRDLQTGEYWSSTHQPTLAGVDSYEAVFSAARAEFKIRKNNFDVHTEIVVSPEEDVELRRVNIVNRSHMRRSIEVTSYAEVVLSDPMADAQHPAFNKLFVQSEIVPEAQTIICSRRPRSRHEGSPHMFHLMATHACSVSGISYETDRSRFVGRGRTLRNPAAMEEYGPLSGGQGAVLDPVTAIRCYIALNPGEACTLDLVVGVGLEREGCMRLAENSATAIWRTGCSTWSGLTARSSCTSLTQASRTPTCMNIWPPPLFTRTRPAGRSAAFLKPMI